MISPINQSMIKSQLILVLLDHAVIDANSQEMTKQELYWQILIERAMAMALVERDQESNLTLASHLKMVNLLIS